MSLDCSPPMKTAGNNVPKHTHTHTHTQFIGIKYALSKYEPKQNDQTKAQKHSPPMKMAWKNLARIPIGLRAMFLKFRTPMTLMCSTMLGRCVRDERSSAGPSKCS